MAGLWGQKDATQQAWLLLEITSSEVFKEGGRPPKGVSYCFRGGRVNGSKRIYINKYIAYQTRSHKIA